MAIGDMSWIQAQGELLRIEKLLVDLIRGRELLARGIDIEKLRGS